MAWLTDIHIHCPQCGNDLTELAELVQINDGYIQEECASCEAVIEITAHVQLEINLED